MAGTGSDGSGCAEHLRESLIRACVDEHYLPMNSSEPIAPGAPPIARETELATFGAQIMRGKISVSYLAYTTFILVSLLIPLRGFYLYYILVSVLIVGFSINCLPQLVNRFTIPFLLLTAFVLWGALLRSFAFHGTNPRDYIEVARFMPVILVYMGLYKWRRLRMESIVDAAFIYLLIDGVVSFLQYTGQDFLGVAGLASHLYSAEHHYIRALGISHRALGLSPGPGQHGAILFILATVMLYGTFTLRSRSLACLLGWMVAIFGVLLSQSQTTFVVTVAIILGVLFSFLFRGTRRQQKKAAVLLSIIGISSVYVFALITSHFRYLFSLFIYGLGRSSYQAREEKWMELFSKAMEQPGWILVGWGKDYFGAVSGAMDSGLLYIFLVYGITVFSIFVFFLVRFLVSSFRKVIIRKNAGDYRFLLFFLMLGGLVYSWPGAFFTSPNVLLFLALIHAASWWQQVHYSAGHAQRSRSAEPYPFDYSRAVT